MARTINGKTTGMAARIEKRDAKLQAMFEDAAWLEEYNRTARELIDIDPDAEAWFFDRPEQTRGEMYPLMVERIEHINLDCEAKDHRETMQSIISEFYPY